MDGVVVDIVVGMAIKVTVEYEIPGVGRAQKTLLPTSVNLRLLAPASPTASPSARGQEAAAAIASCAPTGWAEVDRRPEDANEEALEDWEEEEEEDCEEEEDDGEADEQEEEDDAPREARELQPVHTRKSSVARSAVQAAAAEVDDDDGVEELEEGAIVADGRFQLHHELGSGSFSTVRLAKDLHTGEEVALKLELVSSKYPQLIDEARRYKHFQAGAGLPAMYWYGTDMGYNMMAMQLLGPSLEVMLERCDRSFSLDTVVKLATQMVDCIQFVHSKDYIHRDLKPNNFCLGHHTDKRAQVYCLDFGLAKRYRSPASMGGVHIPFRGNLPFVGTVRYASIGAQMGEEQSRRDDLQALGYVFLYLYNGCLPWQGLQAGNKAERRQKVLEMKQALTNEELCAEAPLEFVGFMDYCFEDLAFDTDPDYDHLRALLREALARQSPRGRGQQQRRRGDELLADLQDGASAVSQK